MRCRQRRWPMREPGPSGKSTWSDSRPSCEISTWRVRVSTPARHWLMRWAPFRRRRRRTSAPRTPTRRGCLTTPSSPWPDDLRQALERGLFCPLELDDSEDIPNVEKYVPYIRRLREAQNPWRRCPIWRHRPPQGCHWPRGTSQCHRRTWTRRRVSCPCSSGR